MPIVAVVVLSIAFWVAYWFVRMGGVDHFQAKKAERKESAQLAKAREGERTAALRAVDDPRDAAAILMFLLARTGGDPTREQVAAIERVVQRHFGFDSELTERVTQARFLAGRAESFEQAAGLLSDLLNKRLTLDERHELLEMLEEVARVDGPSLVQTEAIGTLNRRIGLARAV
jgi:uncharacterized tellurite resistance protein B-like protein